MALELAGPLTYGNGPGRRLMAVVICCRCGRAWLASFFSDAGQILECPHCHEHHSQPMFYVEHIADFLAKFQTFKLNRPAA